MTQAGDYFADAEVIGGARSKGPCRVSVIVACPSSTRPDDLDSTLAGIEAQTIADTEIMLVGEGLAPAAIAVVRRRAGADPRLTARLHARACDLPALRVNEGIAASHGKFLAYQEPGCEWTPDALSSLLDRLPADQAGLVIGRIERSVPGRDLAAFAAPVHFSALMDANPIGLPGVLHPRSVLDETGLFDMHVYMAAHWQWDLWLRMGRILPLVDAARSVGRWRVGEPPGPAQSDAWLEAAFRFAGGVDRRRPLSPDGVAAYGIDSFDAWGGLPPALREPLRKYVRIPWRLRHRFDRPEPPGESQQTEGNPVLATVVSGVHNCTVDVTIGNVQEAAGAEPQPWAFSFQPLASATKKSLGGTGQLVLHRTFQPGAAALLAEARKAGAPVCYMADDDMLGLWEQFQDYAFLAPGQPLRACMEEQITAADAVVLYSDQAVQAYRKLNPRVLVRNISIPAAWIERDFSEPAPGAPFRIGFAGSAGRAEEMAFLMPVLEALSREWGDRIEFAFWGLGLKDAGRLKSPYTFIPYSHSYAEYVRRLRQTHFDLLLAPLFDAPRARRAKTCIKYLETTAAGTVGIYSDVTPYRDVPSPECGLKVPNTPDAWADAIRRLVQMPVADRRRMWGAARADIRRKHTCEVRNDSFMAAMHAAFFHGKTRDRRHADGLPRIAYVLHSLTFAGSEIYHCRRAELVREYGIEPVLCVPEAFAEREGGVREFAANHNIPLHFLPLSAYPYPEYPPRDRLEQEADAMRRWFAEQRIALVHSVNFIPAAGLAAARAGIPHVASLYQPYRDTPDTFRPDAVPHAAVLDSDSFLYARFWEECLDVPAYVIRCPVPPVFFEVGERRARPAGAASPTHRWAVIGAFHERKGQLDVLRALETLGDFEGRIELDLIGLSGYFPDYEEKCREAIARLHAGDRIHVNVVGFSEDVPRLLEQIDVLLMASTSESFPQVALQAMAARTFVVATPVAGIPELILDGRTGLVADGFGAAHLARAIRRYLALPAEDKRDMLDRAAEVVCGEAGWEAVSNRLLWLYREAFRAAAARPAETNAPPLETGEEWLAVPRPYGMVEGISYPVLRKKRYRLQIPENGLDGVQVRIGTYGQRPRNPIRLTLTPAGPHSRIPPRSALWMPDETFREPGWAVFRFPPITESRDQFCEAEFAQEGEAPVKLSFFQFELPAESLARKIEKRLFDRLCVPQVRLSFTRGASAQ